MDTGLECVSERPCCPVRGFGDGAVLCFTVRWPDGLVLLSVLLLALRNGVSCRYRYAAYSRFLRKEDEEGSMGFKTEARRKGRHRYQSLTRNPGINIGIADTRKCPDDHWTE
jgi:hypothetical protein